MSDKTKGALALVVLGVIGVLAAYFILPYLREGEADRQRQEQTDAELKTEIRIGADGYLGYWFALESIELKKRLARQGIKIDYHDDGGAYADRLDAFAKGELDAIILPVSSYLSHGKKHGYPGAIVASIAESRGADGIVGFKGKFPRGTVNDLNQPGLNGVFVADSPSSFLLDLTVSDFDLDELANSLDWQDKVDSQEAVLAKAKARDGDFFVMWEPTLSRAIAEVPGLVPIYGSDQFRGYIVDVIVFRFDYLDTHQKEVETFLSTYFRVLNTESHQRQGLIEKIAKSSHLSPAVVDTMMSKIEWFDIHENCSEQFGIPTQPGGNATDGLINCIYACTDILNRTSHANDRIDKDPLELINSKLVENVLKSGALTVGRRGSAKVEFENLSDAEWIKLPEVGVRRINPISFVSESYRMTESGEDQVDEILNVLQTNYPTLRVIVRGHSSPGQDESMSLQLSKDRAGMVVQRLVALGCDPNRLHAQGMGSAQAPKKRKGESTRVYRRRRQRVEFVLLKANNI